MDFNFLNDLIEKIGALPQPAQKIIGIIMLLALLFKTFMYFTRHTDFERILELKYYREMANVGLVILLFVSMMLFPIFCVAMCIETKELCEVCKIIGLDILICVGFMAVYIWRKKIEKHEIGLLWMTMVAAVVPGVFSCLAFFYIDKYFKVEKINDVSNLPVTIITLIIASFISGLFLYYYSTEWFPVSWYTELDTEKDKDKKNDKEDDLTTWYFYSKVAAGYLCGDEAQKMKASTLKILNQDQFTSAVWKKGEPKGARLKGNKAKKENVFKRVLRKCFRRVVQVFIATIVNILKKVANVCSVLWT